MQEQMLHSTAEFGCKTLLQGRWDWLQRPYQPELEKWKTMDGCTIKPDFKAQKTLQGQTLSTLFETKESFLHTFVHLLFKSIRNLSNKKNINL